MDRRLKKDKAEEEEEEGETPNLKSIDCRIVDVLFSRDEKNEGIIELVSNSFKHIVILKENIFIVIYIYMQH